MMPSTNNTDGPRDYLMSGVSQTGREVSPDHPLYLESKEMIQMNLQEQKETKDSENI